MGLNLDDILNKYAELFKKYQWRRVTAIAILASFIFVNSSFASVFIAFEPDHYFKIPLQVTFNIIFYFVFKFSLKNPPQTFIIRIQKCPVKDENSKTPCCYSDN